MRHPFRASFRAIPAALSLTAALLLPAAARAQWFASDQAVYHVYQQDHLLGTERVTFEQHGDSSVVISTIRQLLPRPAQRSDTLRKNVTLVLASSDGSLRAYQSSETLNGDQLSRSLSMSDETYTSYRQSGAGGGFGDTYARPPGRTYVVDPQVFALFDVICRDMHAQRFDERSITMLYITAKDTAVTGRVTRLGKEPLKLGKETVTAEKFRIVDPWSEFTLWASPNGRMLRMTLPAVGLRVDRDPATLTTGRTLSSVPPQPAGMPQVFMQPTAKPRPPSRPDSTAPGR